MIPIEGTRSARRHKGKSAERPPLVIFAPYPPSRNGIADYVAELMPYHQAEFDVTLVVADDAQQPETSPSCPRILLASEFRKHRNHFADAPKLYHVGNNPAHCYILDLIGRDPGIVVLHDFNLNYLHDSASQGWHEPEGYWPVHQVEYGALGGDSVRWAFEREHRGQFATYELPLNGDVLEAATGVITHSRYVQYKVAARVPRTSVWHVPHHVTPLVDEFTKLTKMEARRQLGLPEHEFFVTALGFISYAKRISMLLAALADLRTRVPEFRLILGGEKRPREYDVDGDIAAHGLKSRTITTGYLDEGRFFRHLAASDLIVNLRHPTGGESSGTLIRALGMGKPVLVFDHGPIGELPDDAVVKVPWNNETPKVLTKTLQELITNQSLRSAFGRRAAAYARAVHGIPAIARRYSGIIRGSNDLPRPQAREALTQYFPAARSVAQAVMCRSAEAKAHPANGELWWRSGGGVMGRLGRKALVIAQNPQATARWLSELFDWAPETIVAMTIEDFLAPKLRNGRGEPIPMGAFTYALCVVSAELQEGRAAGLLRRLNAAICRGGTLALEVCFAPDAETDEAPLPIERLPQRIVDAGFAVLRSPAAQDSIVLDLLVSTSRSAAESRAACVLARKVSDYSLWRYTQEVAGTPMRFGGRVC